MAVTRVRRQACGRPDRTALMIVTAAMNATERTSNATSSMRGRSVGIVGSHAQARERDRRAEHAAGQREQRRLEQEFADQPAGGGAERDAHGDFVLSIEATHQGEERHVRAGDQQHEADGGQQHPQHGRRATDGFNGQGR